MGINQLYNDNLRKLPNEYGHVSVMGKTLYYNVEFLIVYNCAKFHGSDIICSKVTVKCVVKNVTSVTLFV